MLCNLLHLHELSFQSKDDLIEYYYNILDCYTLEYSTACTYSFKKDFKCFN